MVTLHFKVYYKMPDGGEIPQPARSEFLDPVEAQDIMHSMECGVFDDLYTRYVVDRIVYELDSKEEVQ